MTLHISELPKKGFFSCLNDISILKISNKIGARNTTAPAVIVNPIIFKVKSHIDDGNARWLPTREDYPIKLRSLRTDAVLSIIGRNFHGVLRTS